MLRKMPIILVIIIIALLLLDPIMPLSIKQILYAISLTVKSGIIFILPFIIFSLLFKAAVGLASRATFVIALILIFVCLSNFLSTFLSHYVGSWIYHFNFSILLPKGGNGLTPAWSWQIPKIFPNDIAMFLGIICGILLGIIKAPLANKIAASLDLIVTRILDYFVYIIPVFVAGFIVKMQYDDILQTIFKDYPLIFAVIALAQFTYVIFAYFAINKFNVVNALTSLKNMVPAGIAGFSTMSSAAAMPLTLEGVDANAQNKDLAKSIVPATVNIHLVGDCFAIPILAYAVLKSYGFAEPSLYSYLIFVMYFVLAKFSVAAIPGGGILVMLPILESYLGFNSEMLSLITALYILFDPVITCANVFGNGAFASLIDKIVGKRLLLSKDKSDLQSYCKVEHL